MKNTCLHTRSTSAIRPYAGAIWPTVDGEHDRRAHGGVCIVERCAACGAERRTNSNGGHTEEGFWFRESEEAE